MPSIQGPTVSAKQLAMSRALGAAFLSHQVEQLEKSVNARGGPGSANWRDRQHTARPVTTHQRSHPRSTSATPSTASRKARDTRKSSDEEREREADIIVIDASVLVHALYQVKRWCKDGREEILIVPLEGELCIHDCSPCLDSTALNTLDLLKKGTTSLAQRARAASRILEAQVGTNPRIRVQRDEAFVYWDKITFNTAEDSTIQGSSPPTLPHPVPSPEWVRRTVCCAKWEVDNPLVELGISNTGSKPPKATPRVIFATLSPQSSSSQPGLDSDQQQTISTPIVPVVPLPTTYSPGSNNKFEPRSSGTLVSYWASRAGIEVLEVDAAAPGHGRGAGAGEWKEGEDDEAVGPRGASLGGGRKSHYGHGHVNHGHGNHSHAGRRKPSVSSTGGGGDNAGSGTANASVGVGPGLVERPPAVMAMMEMVSQPSKVVRVLARGEKLDP